MKETLGFITIILSIVGHEKLIRKNKKDKINTLDL